VVTAGGNFNPDKGGMIVLWELGLIVRFPPGSTVLFTSGDITHFNIPIQEGETRWSFTQYMAIALVTHARTHCVKLKDMSKDARRKHQRAMKDLKVKERCLYSTRESLIEDRRRLLNQEGSFLELE
jgi:hypothetical protein